MFLFDKQYLKIKLSDKKKKIEETDLYLFSIIITLVAIIGFDQAIQSL